MASARRHVCDPVALLVCSHCPRPRIREQKPWLAALGDKLAFRARRMGEVYQYHRFSLEPAWGNLARSTGYREIGIGSRHHRPFICYADCDRTYSADRHASRSEKHPYELQSLLRN